MKILYIIIILLILILFIKVNTKEKFSVYDFTNEKSDKIYHHGYHRYYKDYISRDIKKLLEIGIQEGHSINLWLNYCSNVFVYGLDIGVEKSGDRYKIFKGDQYNKNDLENLKKNIGCDLDVIIDDGSHVPEHQIFSFEILFPCLKDGGIYIIEDIETSYWKNGELYNYKINYGKEHEWNLINIFKDVLHILNREFINENEINNLKNKLKISMNIIDSISTITFGQNCIIIKKKEQYEYKYLNRKYRFEHFIF